MSAPLLTAMPATIRAGETTLYTRVLPNFPASDGWVLTVGLRGVGLVNAAVATNANGRDFDVTITAAQTTGLAPGNYQWFEQVTLAGGESHVATVGVICVLQNLAAAAAGDAQTINEKLLALVETRLQGDRITNDMETFSIAGRAIARIPYKELWGIRTSLRWAVWQERNPGQVGRNAYVTFSGPEMRP